MERLNFEEEPVTDASEVGACEEERVDLESETLLSSVKQSATTDAPSIESIDDKLTRSLLRSVIGRYCGLSTSLVPRLTSMLD